MSSSKVSSMLLFVLLLLVFLNMDQVFGATYRERQPKRSRDSAPTTRNRLPRINFPPDVPDHPEILSPHKLFPPRGKIERAYKNAYSNPLLGHEFLHPQKSVPSSGKFPPMHVPNPNWHLPRPVPVPGSLPFRHVYRPRSRFPKCPKINPTCQFSLSSPPPPPPPPPYMV